jgi:hypothetical protein
MPGFNSQQHQYDRGIRWRGIAATAMVELLVLFALSFAVVRYVEWSSAANLAEFMSETEPSSVANHSGGLRCSFDSSRNNLWLAATPSHNPRIYGCPHVRDRHFQFAFQPKVDSAGEVLGNPKLRASWTFPAMGKIAN